MGRFLLRFYGPLLLGVVILALLGLSPQFVVSGPRVELEVGLLIGVLGVKIPLATWLENIWLIRFIASLAAFSCFAYSLSIDFSRYFPRRFAMDVYFDLKGIKRTLRLFSEHELGDLKPPDNWEARISVYDSEVVDGLNGLWAKRGTQNAPLLESMGRDLLHAHGEGTLDVKRLRWLVYKVTAGSGFLQLVLENRNRPVFRFRSEYYLRDTGVNHVRPKLLELAPAPTVVLRPEFKQVFQIEQGGEDAPFDHVVVATTKVRLLPTPSFSDTIYLWRDPAGNTVPVAYAIYSSTGDIPETRSTAF